MDLGGSRAGPKGNLVRDCLFPTSLNPQRPVRFESKSLFRIFTARAREIPQESRSGQGLERSGSGAPGQKPFLSRRFVIGSLVALGIVAANAFVSYLTIANLIEASRIVENTLKVVQALKDVQDNVIDSEIELRRYVITGDGDRLARAHAFLSRTSTPIQALRDLTRAIPDQIQQVELLAGLIVEELDRFDTLIEVHREQGVSATIRSIQSTASAATIQRIQALTAGLLAAEDLRLARRTEQFKRSSDVSVVTAAVATLLNLGLLGIVILLARREIRDRRQAEEVIKFAATHDPLTGLPNRLLLAERVNRALSAMKGKGRAIALLFLDLDRFKIINDTLGHEAGDRLLQNVAGRLARCVRRSDTIARQGGDEFVVLIEAFQGAGDLAQVAEKILAGVAEPMMVYGKEFQITASIGISTCPTDGEDLRALLQNADIAMYRAKELGNAYQFYSEQMNPHSVERLELEAALRHALERNELTLNYQPKVEARSGRVTGIECLLRWQHPTLGSVPPDQLVPLAEETGLIVPIGKWALRTACVQARSWAKQGLPLLRMAVNLSARQFSSATFLDDVIGTLEETGMDPRLIEFEVTESVMIQEPEQAVQLLRNLKAIGVRITIDDFGTGYSSLAYLKRLPIDCVKIDASFVRGIPVDASDVAITETILAMSGSLGLAVVAEGVETRDQMRFLERRGCDEMQGFYFSKPLPAEELAFYLRDQQAASTESGPRDASSRLKIVSGGERRTLK
jgi:diguanylate cyclase (GGDEF)-like protein